MSNKLERGKRVGDERNGPVPAALMSARRRQVRAILSRHRPSCRILSTSRRCGLSLAAGERVDLAPVHRTVGAKHFGGRGRADTQDLPIVRSLSIKRDIRESTKLKVSGPTSRRGNWS